MARVYFTSHLQRHVPCPDEDVAGDNLRAVLDGYFARHAAARSYVLDEQAALRKHVVIFIDGQQLRDRVHLPDAVAPDAQVHVKDEQRVPVDAAVVVARTRDAGASWQVLREGLPQRHAYDIVLRHALAVDDTGQRLAFGSSTGSLWISDDAGDHFACVSTHLPPIYGVTFA